MNDAALREGRGVHAALNAFDEVDVLHLQNLIQVSNCIELHFVRFRGFQKEVVGLKRSVRPRRNDVENDHARPARVSHQAGCRPKPPDRMGFNGCIGHIVSGIRRIPCVGHMAGIDAASGYLVGVHIHQVAKILVGGRAMIALKEIVDDVLPVRLDVVGQAMAECELVNVWRPMTNFTFKIARLFGQ